MAQLAAAAILTRVREVVEDAAGSIRIITADAYRPGAHEGLTSDAQSTQALIRPRAEARFTDVSPHGARPPEQGSFTLYAVEVEVAVTRYVGVEHMLSEDVRTTLRAVAAEDASRLAQALGWPGNLTATTAGTATGLVSGMLRHTGSQIGELEADDGQNGRIVTTHSFEGVARVELPVSVPVSLTAPVLSGTPTVGSTLVVTTGTWYGGGTLSYGYEWLADGSPITGAANAATYELTADETGALVSCVVTATNEAGAQSAASNALGPVT